MWKDWIQNARPLVNETTNNTAFIKITIQMTQNACKVRCLAWNLSKRDHQDHGLDTAVIKCMEWPSAGPVREIVTTPKHVIHHQVLVKSWHNLSWEPKPQRDNHHVQILSLQRSQQASTTFAGMWSSGVWWWVGTLSTTMTPVQIPLGVPHPLKGGFKAVKRDHVCGCCIKLFPIELHAPPSKQRDFTSIKQPREHHYILKTQLHRSWNRIICPKHQIFLLILQSIWNSRLKLRNNLPNSRSKIP